VPVVQETIQHCAYRGGITQQLAPVINGRFEVTMVLARS